MAIAIIRLKGKMGLSPKVRTTLSSLNLNRLYHCTVVPENESFLGMVKACKDFVSFGKIDQKTMELLLAKKGRLLDGKKVSSAKSPKEIEELAKGICSSNQPLSKYSLIPFFALSPPKGGFQRSRKAQAPLGPLGKNAKIAELIERMV